jgi:hypothetical protein
VIPAARRVASRSSRRPGPSSTAVRTCSRDSQYAPASPQFGNFSRLKEFRSARPRPPGRGSAVASVKLRLAARPSPIELQVSRFTLKPA